MMPDRSNDKSRGKFADFTFSEMVFEMSIPTCINQKPICMISKILEQVKCQFCNRKFKNAKRALNHENRMHRFACPFMFCGRRFKNRFELETHLHEYKHPCKACIVQLRMILRNCNSNHFRPGTVLFWLPRIFRCKAKFQFVFSFISLQVCSRIESDKYKIEEGWGSIKPWNYLHDQIA